MDIFGIIVTIIGLLLVLAEAGVEAITAYNGWIIAILVLVIGVGRLAKKL